MLIHTLPAPDGPMTANSFECLNSPETPLRIVVPSCWVSNRKRLGARVVGRVICLTPCKTHTHHTLRVRPS